MEGEFLSGSPERTFYYGTDQVGSVRRAFVSASYAPAYAFDPFGSPLQATTLLTDFGYAGMFSSADSGLSLTFFRAYDTALGRWLFA